MLNSTIRSLSELSDSELRKLSSAISKELDARKAKTEVVKPVRKSKPYEDSYAKLSAFIMRK